MGQGESECPFQKDFKDRERTYLAFSAYFGTGRGLATIGNSMSHYIKQQISIIFWCAELHRDSLRQVNLESILKFQFYLFLAKKELLGGDYSDMHTVASWPLLMNQLRRQKLTANI